MTPKMRDQNLSKQIFFHSIYDRLGFEKRWVLHEKDFTICNDDAPTLIKNWKRLLNCSEKICNLQINRSGPHWDKNQLYFPKTQFGSDISKMWMLKENILMLTKTIWIFEFSCPNCRNTRILSQNLDF